MDALSNDSVVPSYVDPTVLIQNRLAQVSDLIDVSCYSITSHLMTTCCRSFIVAVESRNRAPPCSGCRGTCDVERCRTNCGGCLVSSDASPNVPSQPPNIARKRRRGCNVDDHRICRRCVFWMGERRATSHMHSGVCATRQWRDSMVVDSHLACQTLRDDVAMGLQAATSQLPTWSAASDANTQLGHHSLRRLLHPHYALSFRQC